MQELIASALSIGIGKRELLEDYYPDEIGAIIGAWNDLHNPHRATEETETIDPLAFFGDGGERVGSAHLGEAQSEVQSGRETSASPAGRGATIERPGDGGERVG